MFFKMDVLKNFSTFTGKKPVLEYLFKNACNFIKKRLQYICFPVNTVKVLRTAFLENTTGGRFYFSFFETQSI